MERRGKKGAKGWTLTGTYSYQWDLPSQGNECLTHLTFFKTTSGILTQRRKPGQHQKRQRPTSEHKRGGPQSHGEVPGCHCPVEHTPPSTSHMLEGGRSPAGPSSWGVRITSTGSLRRLLGSGVTWASGGETSSEAEPGSKVGLDLPI